MPALLGKIIIYISKTKMEPYMNWSEIKNFKETEIVVAGAGMAGCGAAIAAARKGVKVLLIENGGCLGGMATAGLVTPLAADRSTNGEDFGGIIAEVRDEIQAEARKYLYGSAWMNSAPHIIKNVLLEKVLGSGAEILFHTQIIDLEKDRANCISRLITASKSGILGIKAKIFIDCTGDADLIKMSGEEYVTGSEPDVLRQMQGSGLDKVHESDISYSKYPKDGVMQPVSIMFNMGGVDYEKAKSWCNRNLIYTDLGITKEDFLKLPYSKLQGFEPGDNDLVPLPQGRVLFFPLAREGEVTVNMSRVTGVDGTDTDALSSAEIIAQRQVFAIIDFLRRFVPGFEKSYLIETAATLGVRETRRLKGQYILKGIEAINCVKFKDVIAHGSYIIDIHDPCGKKKAIGGPIKGDRYDIPFRSLLPKTIRNLLVAGRCISADHVAHSSTRIQGTCMLTGQAVGTAAAIAVKTKNSPVKIDVKELQQTLIKDSVNLIL